MQWCQVQIDWRLKYWVSTFISIQCIHEPVNYFWNIKSKTRFHSFALIQIPLTEAPVQPKLIKKYDIIILLINSALNFSGCKVMVYSNNNVIKYLFILIFKRKDQWFCQLNVIMRLISGGNNAWQNLLFLVLYGYEALIILLCNVVHET